MKRTTLPRMVGPALMAGLAVQFACSSWVAAADKPASVDLSEFRTVEKAVTARISQASPNVAAQVAYLGIQLVRDNQGKMTLGDVAPDSPAAKAGLERGDVLVRLAGQNVTGTEGLRELLQARSPGEKVQLEVVRQGKPLEVNATLDATSRPMRLGARRAVLGIGIGEPEGGKGVAISEVFPDSPAARANLKAGEIILKIDGVALNGPDKLRDILSEKNPGDVVTVTVQKPNSSQDLKLKLGEAAGSEGRSFREPRGPGRYWDKKVYRLAVIPVEYPDVKHNSKISIADWEKALFSTGAYTSKSPTGQEVHGSLNDYYLEQSYGRFHVEGKVFDWVKVDKNRGEYVEDTGFERRQGLLTAAMDKLLEREGEDALKDFDGICFLYAGGRYRTSRGGLYWPHRSTFRYEGQRWPYFIVPEGGARMDDISVMCHEFGHMLGLPDLYGQPGVPGSVGIGAWCAMSIQAGNGRPQHFSAWCKEQLGWLQPAVIDPSVPQKLILSPVEDSPRQCFKVLVKRDGSEYLLLENRRKQGFDRSIPAEGLLVWRVVNNKPILEESHGISGPAGPQVYTQAVPYPSVANNSFTPYTVPSSRSSSGNGLPVYLTNIRQLPDGRITFYIGYEYE